MWWLVAAYAAVTTVAFQVIYNAQPTPFIDEIFHVPQAQKICSGNFWEWDPKITTLPGMYIGSFIVSLIPSIFIKTACSVWALRYLNVAYNSSIIVLSFLIFKELRGTQETTKDKVANIGEENSNLSALIIGIFPLLYFFSFLYYTEPGSTLLVLASYLFCLRDEHKIASGISILSILFRQTNIIWTLFMAGTIVAKHIDDLSEMEKIKTSPEVKDKFARFLAKVMVFVVRYLLVVEHLLTIATLIWPYAAVGVLFALFVYFNGGITVGDRSSHVAVTHFAQLLYFSGFALCFMSPVLLTFDKVKRFMDAVKKHKVEFMVAIFACIYVLMYHSYEHPYLLADNRHYVFYLWRWLLRRTFIRYGLIPVYIYSFWSICDSMSHKYTFLWKAVLGICITAVLVPQKLLEFRYFILPYILVRMHLERQPYKTLLLEILLDMCVNVFTIFVFVQKTFTWADMPGMQHVIW